MKVQMVGLSNVYPLNPTLYHEGSVLIIVVKKKHSYNF